MVHYGKTGPDELKIIITGDDIRALRRAINSSSLTERRNFHNLQSYITDNFN